VAETPEANQEEEESEPSLKPLDTADETPVEGDEDDASAEEPRVAGEEETTELADDDAGEDEEQV
jgi:hypothetical protein